MSDFKEIRKYLQESSVFTLFSDFMFSLTPKVSVLVHPKAVTDLKNSLYPPLFS